MYDYSLEKLIDNRLWSLIPFYFFNFNLEEMDSSEEIKRIARAAAEKAEEETTKKKDLKAVKNMISFGVPEEKILSKYPKSVYDEALKLVELENSEPKEM